MIHPTLEQHLVRAAGIWKWQAVIKATTWVVSILLVVALVLGGLAHFQWVTSRSFVMLMLVIAAVIGFTTWLVLLILTVDRKLDRRRLAAAMEHNQTQLMDRLNVLVQFEQSPYDKSAEMFSEQIQRQASAVLQQDRGRQPFSWLATMVHVAAMLFLMLCTTWFYSRFQPLAALAAGPTPSESAGDDPNAPLAIPELPDHLANDPILSANSGDPWGQVRISDPGRNLRVTRHEDVRLLIEAAADRPLSEVYWSTAVNLKEESKHGLPEFEDPRYAAFQPTLSPADLGLDDWDLAHYRAVAVAEDATQYESLTYFVEIIPSRDQLDQMPESAYEQIEEISELIEQQQEVIRQTDQSDSADPARRLEALAEQENRIAASAQQFREAVNHQLPSDAVESFDATLQAAAKSLAAAESALRQQDAQNAAEPERAALMKLAQARAQLAELVDQYPEAFEPSTLEDIQRQREQGASAADPDFARLLEKLDREARDNAAAAAQIAALADDQQQLAAQASDQPADQLDALEPKQRQIGQEFRSVRQTFPQTFQDLIALSEQASNSLERAGQQLQQASPTAPLATQRAHQHLQQIANELQRRQLAYQMAQGQTLQERLQDNRQQYQQIQDEPQQASPEQIQETTEETRQLVDELQQLAGADPSAGPESALAKHLSPETADRISRQCDAIDQADGDSQRSRMAAGIGKSLDQLSQALAQEVAEQTANLDQQQVASQMQQMQQREESLQSARQSVQQTLLQQRSIQRTAYTDRREKKRYEQLAEQQLELQQALQQAMDQHPDAFEPASGQCQSAQSAMRQTTQSLNSKAANASDLADRAAQRLQDLDDALKQQQVQDGISNEQMVREMLDRLDQRLEQMARQPQSVTEQQKRQTAGQCKSVGSQACQMAGQNPGGNSGTQGSPSAASASSGGQSSGGQSSGGQSSGGQSSGGSDRREQQIRQASDRLAAAQGNQQTAAAARDLQQQLQQLAADLDGQQGGRQQGDGQQGDGQQGDGQQGDGQQGDGQQGDGQQGDQQAGSQQRSGSQQAGLRQSGSRGPSGSQTSPSRDSLRPSGQEAIERGLAQLESAARRNGEQTLTPQASGALRRGGIADIAAGIRSHYGYNENSRAVLTQLNEQLQDPGAPVDMKTLQQLREQIQSLQQDLALQTPQASTPGIRQQINPNRFPADYRKSIQKYYESLSEQP